MILPVCILLVLVCILLVLVNDCVQKQEGYSIQWLLLLWKQGIPDIPNELPSTGPTST